MKTKTMVLCRDGHPSGQCGDGICSKRYSVNKQTHFIELLNLLVKVGVRRRRHNGDMSEQHSMLQRHGRQHELLERAHTRVTQCVKTLTGKQEERARKVSSQRIGRTGYAMMKEKHLCGD